MINEVVNSIDSSSIEKGYSYLGQKSYHPRLLLKIWFSCYSTGTLSGSGIARRCECDTAYMFLASMHTPNFRTINDFRKDNLEFFGNFFKQVLQICREVGMGKMGLLAIDGTNIRANASANKNMNNESYQQWLTQVVKQINDLNRQVNEINLREDAELGHERYDELPKELIQKQQLKQ